LLPVGASHWPLMKFLKTRGAAGLAMKPPRKR
jgi:hypothetical protein